MSIPKRNKASAQARMGKSLFQGAGVGFGLPAQNAKKAAPVVENTDELAITTVETVEAKDLPSPTTDNPAATRTVEPESKPSAPSVGQHDTTDTAEPTDHSLNEKARVSEQARSIDPLNVQASPKATNFPIDSADKMSDLATYPILSSKDKCDPETRVSDLASAGAEESNPKHQLSERAPQAAVIPAPQMSDLAPVPAARGGGGSPIDPIVSELASKPPTRTTSEPYVSEAAPKAQVDTIPVTRPSRTISRAGADKGGTSRYKRPVTLRLPADIAEALDGKAEALGARSLNQLLVALLQSAADSPNGFTPYMRPESVSVAASASLEDRVRAFLALNGGKRADDIHQISLRLPSDLGAKITKVAKGSGRKVSPFLIEVISAQLLAL